MGALNVELIMKVFNSGIFPMLFCLWFMRREDSREKARAIDQGHQAETNRLLRLQAKISEDLEKTVERQSQMLTRLDTKLNRLATSGGTRPVPIHPIKERGEDD